MSTPFVKSPRISDYIPDEDEPIGGEKAPKRKALPDIENAADLLVDESLTLPPLIIIDVLHQGLKAVIGAPSKVGKTWLLLDLALSVAAGVDWWKFPTRKGKVLYVNFEFPPAFIKKRIRLLAERKKLSDVSNLEVWSLRGRGAALTSQELIAEARKRGYDLIVIDPIYKWPGDRDENSAGAIGELCNELERIAVETGAAVVFAAHFSKGNQAYKDPLDRISGSGVFARDPDVIITLTQHQVKDAYTVELKLRNLPEQPPFVVKWDFPLMTIVADLEPVKLKQPRGGKMPKVTPTEEEFLSLFRADANNPRSCLLSGTELRDVFRKKNWDESAAPGLRDRYASSGKLRVLQGRNNQKLVGLPAMAELFQRSGQK